MELQLGLALPIHNSNKGFDLNCQWFEPKQLVGSETWSHGVGKKRGFEEALPLLLWSGQPNEEDDEKGSKKRTFCSINMNGGEENDEVVGWPPIKSWRKKSLHQNQGNQEVHSNRTGGKENDGSNTMYIKVKMEGVPIARKTDLSLFHSYQMLTDTLITMFAKYRKCDEGGASYTLTYQDREGDWLLAGDVPWQTFIETVQRLEIRKNGG